MTPEQADTNTTEAVERLEAWADDLDRSAEIALRKPDLASTAPRLATYRSRAADLRALLSERTALLERVERAEAGNLHPLAEKVWQQSCQGWMDRAQAAETKLATLTEALLLSVERHEARDMGDDDVIAFARAALSQTQEEKTNG